MTITSRPITRATALALLLTGLASMHDVLAQTGKLNLFMGSSSSSSTSYPIVVSEARVINKHVPEVQITVLETGATHDNMQRMARGQLRITGATGYDGPVMAYHGLYQYKAKPLKQVRTVLIERQPVLMFVVRADSGVKTFRELHGKPFYAGIPGSGAEFNARLLFKKLAIEPKLTFGSLADGVEAIKEGRIVGMVKYSPGARSIDSSLMDIKTRIPVRILSLTEEESKAAEVVPGHSRVDLSSDSTLLKGIQSEAVVAIGVGAGIFASADLPADIVYKIIKGLDEDWKKELGGTFADLATVDVIGDTIRGAAGVEQPVPLHAGVVKYFTERGHKIPATLLPPEWRN
ncbi:MAG: hypothetical protein A3H27_17535 [Acidobacteria bacterium RIFCSPLOWO2_02_FULL_59_13]|nr:MAG: hypothetical protein A3H27_17535 [Acidobacteria bacterium RIFCSPLOWO2_02_FULL_59_13]OGA72003.1 MAG: hypothetical protein A3G81_32005 [Betaproteobacteria bacterium RIFCSPLOWO2_12_FULL_65_14]